MAWIAYAASALASMYGANKSAQAAKKSTDAASQLYGVQANLLKALGPYSVNFYKKAQDAYAPAFQYYSSVAGGDRQKIMSSLAPELNAIGGKYSSLIDATRTLQPRGGASASYNADLVWRAADESQALINQRRAEAIANLVKLAGVAGDLGAGAGGTATNSGAGAGGLLATITNANASSAAQQAAMYGEVGKSIGAMFNDPSFKAMFK